MLATVFWTNIWAKQLESTTSGTASYAVLLFNRGDWSPGAGVPITFKLSSLGAAFADARLASVANRTCTLTDVWNASRPVQRLDCATASFTTMVPDHGCVLLRVVVSQETATSGDVL